MEDHRTVRHAANGELRVAPGRRAERLSGERKSGGQTSRVPSARLPVGPLTRQFGTLNRPIVFSSLPNQTSRAFLSKIMWRTVLPPDGTHVCSWSRSSWCRSRRCEPWLSHRSIGCLPSLGDPEAILVVDRHAVRHATFGPPGRGHSSTFLSSGQGGRRSRDRNPCTRSCRRT